MSPDVPSTRPLSARLGPRREFQILVPGALLILVCLSTFTLFSYRSTLDLLFTEKERELQRLARAVAAALGSASTLSELGLQQLLPPGTEATLRHPGGAVLLAAGVEGAGSAVGEWGEIVATVPVERAGSTLVLRLEQPAVRLFQSRDSLRILLPVVLLVNGAVVLLILLSVRQFLAPLNRMVEQAQRIRPPDPSQDEVAFLLETFDQALRALARPPDDDLWALRRSLAPSLESGALLTDGQGAVIALNEVGARLLGIPVPAPGLPADQVLAAHPELLRLLTQAIDEGRSEPRSECTLQVAGEPRVLGLTLHLLRRDDGCVRGFLVLFVDLTRIRERQLEERLAETLTDLGEIAAGVAHELRNSVATLRGYLTLIERGGEAETIADYAQEIRRETEHLSRVAADFLAFARPGTARSENLDLLALVQRAAADPALAGLPIRIASDCEARPIVRGDAQLLERAVRNLLHNAAAAEREQDPENGFLEVALQQHGTAFALCIDDHGRGIPPEIRPRLFRPFVSGRPGGVGLGLALSLRIVHLHGGDLRLEDRPEGGTRAILTLRAVPEE